MRAGRQGRGAANLVTHKSVACQRDRERGRLKQPLSRAWQIVLYAGQGEMTQWRSRSRGVSAT